MLATLILKEIQNNLLNRRVAICYILIFVLILFSVITRGIQYENSLKTYHRNIEEFNKGFDPSRIAEWDERWWEYEVHIKPSVLSIFCEGYHSSISRPYRVDLDTKYIPGQINFRNPIFEVFKVYDLSLIMALILSLLIIFVSYDALSGEREQKTMGLVMANPISKSTFLLGKFLGGYCSIIIPFILSLICSLALLGLVTGFSVSGGDVVRLVGMVAFFCLYAGVFFLLCILGSTFFRSSSFALMVLLTAWVGLAFMVPFSAYAFSKQLVPVMSSRDFIDLDSKITREENSIAYRSTRVLDPKAPNRQILSTVIYSSAHFRAGRRVKKVIDKRYRDSFSQKETEKRLARISPVASFLYGVSNLAGTGLYDFYRAHRWKHHLRDQTQWTQGGIWLDHHKYLAETGLSTDEAYKLRFPKMDLKKLPSRHYQAPPVSQGFKHSLPDFLVLCIESIVLFMVCFMVFIKKGISE